MRRLLGEEYPAFLASYDQPPTSGLRLNTLKLSAVAFQALSPYSLTPLPWCPSGFLIGDTSTPLPPGKHPYHAAGLYYLQDPSAMAAAEVLAPRPGEKVLDLSAAPGGKSTHLAALMQNQGLLVANEIHAQRAWDLAENLERCGVRIAAITNATPARLADTFGAFFDRVLVDAPCSGEGMFRKSEAARREWQPEMPAACAIRQSAILEEAARLLRPGGRLAYTTCTFAPEENEAVIGRFLAAHPEFALLPLPLSPSLLFLFPRRPDWSPDYAQFPLAHAARLWPHRLQGEGHFIALLQKDPAAAHWPGAAPGSLPRLPRPVQQLFNTFCEQALVGERLPLTAPERLALVGSYLYQLPPELPDLGKAPGRPLKVLHPGWWLGTLKKERFEPSHALALGLSAADVQRTHPLAAQAAETLAYLRGESLPAPGPDGWTLVTIDGFPLGWGRRVKGQLKNHYPHGLRRYNLYTADARK
jgi:NOL1/NOP2/sun family putative RNA methylase